MSDGASLPPKLTIAAGGGDDVNGPAGREDSTRAEREKVARQNRERIEQYRADAALFAKSSESVCILFADLVGSTAFKYGKPAIEGIYKSFQHNSEVQKVVESTSHRGEVVKFMGDGVMAYFVEPRGGPKDAARRAVMAALDIVAAFEAYNKQFSKDEWAKEIVTKIGLHYGPVWMLPFQHANRLDPQGPVVDLASRLCEMAPYMHALMTADTFSAAAVKEVAGSAQYTGPERRRLKGVKAPQDLYTLTTNARAAQEIPLPGTMPLPGDEARAQLKHAAALFTPHQPDRNNIEQAEGIYKGLLAQDGRNFLANYRLAELLALHHWDTRDEKQQERLGRAYDCLCEAKVERPHSCYVWKLLSWVQYQRFLFECQQGKDCHERCNAAYLSDAVRYASHALHLAEGTTDEFGAAVAKIYLIIYLNERIRCRFPTADQDRQLAARYVEECQHTIDRGPDRWLQSSFQLGKAMTKHAEAAGDSEHAKRAVSNLVVEALKLNPENRLAAAFLDAVLNRGSNHGPLVVPQRVRAGGPPGPPDAGRGAGPA